MRTLIVISCLFWTCPLAAQDKKDAKEPKDVQEARQFLEKKFPGKKWQSGPTKLQTPELEKVYGKKGFYYVASTPPLPPGANLPELIKRFAEQMKDFQENYVMATVMRLEDGGFKVLKAPDDFNANLAKVTSADEAKLAAAAILSLFGSDRVGPGAVAAKEVRVQTEDKVWEATVERPNAFQGQVRFDKATGRCLSISKSFAGPVPP